MKKEKVQYEFTKDYGLAGKKKGDKVSLTKLPFHLKSYLKQVGTADVTTTTGSGDDELDTPTEEWTNPDIIDWLSNNGVEARGTKAELMAEVKKVLKAKKK